MTTTTTAERVQDLLDRYEITELVHRLAACLDEGRFDGLRTVLTDDATASTPGGAVAGLEAVIAQARRIHPATERIQHVISNVLVDLHADGDGQPADRATVRADLVVTFAPVSDRPAPRLMEGEVYRFAARRTPGGWRLARIEATPVWISE